MALADKSHKLKSKKEGDGISQVMNSRSKAENVIWTIVIFAVVILIARGIFMTVENYIYQPTMTHLTVDIAPEFPAILACDPYWINEEKMKFNGWGIPEFRALGEHSPFPSWHHDMKNLTNIGRGFFELAQGKSVNELVRSVAWEKEEMVSYAAFMDHRVEVKTEFITTSIGPCVRLVNQAELSQMDADGISMVVLLNKHWPAFNQTDTIGMYALFYFGLEAYSLYPEGAVLVGRKKNTKISVRPMMLHRVSKCKRDTKIPYSACKLHTANTFCKRQGKKEFYNGEEYQQIDQIGTFYKKGSRCDIFAEDDNGDTTVDYIAANCFPPCDVTIYDATVTPIDDAPEEHDILVFSLQNPTKTVVVEEKYVATVDTLLSNIGGQVGLWSGASIITLVQALVFCMFRLKKNGQTEEGR